MIVYFKSLQALFKHPFRFFLLGRNFTDDFFSQTVVSLVGVLHLVLDVVDASIDVIDLALLLFFSHDHTSLRYASKPLVSISSTSSTAFLDDLAVDEDVDKFRCDELQDLVQMGNDQK